jgi:hypothetical protein
MSPIRPSTTLSIHDVTGALAKLGFDQIVRMCPQLENFDRYILNHFLHGI